MLVSQCKKWDEILSSCNEGGRTKINVFNQTIKKEKKYKKTFHLIFNKLFQIQSYSEPSPHTHSFFHLDYPPNLPHNIHPLLSSITHSISPLMEIVARQSSNVHSFICSITHSLTHLFIHSSNLNSCLHDFACLIN